MEPVQAEGSQAFGLGFSFLFLGKNSELLLPNSDLGLSGLDAGQ